MGVYKSLYKENIHTVFYNKHLFQILNDEENSYLSKNVWLKNVTEKNLSDLYVSVYATINIFSYDYCEN